MSRFALDHVGWEAHISLSVSIIVDNYNYARFIKQAIDSALQQTCPPLEVIVVDDGSTDDSREIIRAYDGRLVPVLKENGGQASALNAGLAASHGELIIFLDADDVLLPHATQQVVEAFGRNSALVRVQYRMEVIDAHGKRTGILKPARHLPLLGGDLARNVLNFPDDLPWLPTSGNAFTAPVLRRIFPIPEPSFRILADLYLTNVTPLFGAVETLNRVCACYRVHGQNNYEPLDAALDLQHIRTAIVHQREVHACIAGFADELGLPDRPEQVLSVSYIANRITSLKLEPQHHPMAGDTLAKLFRLSLHAIARRFDASWLMKFTFAAWFALMTIAPPRLARRLAEMFFFPEKRGVLNPVPRECSAGKGAA